MATSRLADHRGFATDSMLRPMPAPARRLCLQRFIVLAAVAWPRLAPAMPPAERDASTPWTNWPMQLRTSTSHEEGCERNWSINTKAFVGDENGNLKALKLVDLDWQTDPDTGRMAMREVAGSEREIPCELALLAAGFEAKEIGMFNPAFAGV